MAYDEKRAELTEHLTELRTRLLRSIVYVIIGTIAAWFFYDQLLALLTKPMVGVMSAIGSKFLLTSFPEAFMVQLQVCLIAGLIVMSPLVLFELWGFVSPALTKEEKRPLWWTMPLAAVLFLSGVTLCYFILPTGFGWFATFIPKHAEFRPTLQHGIRFSALMMLAFGIVFELPVLLMLLAKVGIVNSRMLKENWRVAMVLVSVVAAIATPSNDAFSMLMMAVPVAGLYFASILLVKLVEGKRRKE